MPGGNKCRAQEYVVMIIYQQQKIPVLIQLCKLDSAGGHRTMCGKYEELNTDRDREMSTCKTRKIKIKMMDYMSIFLLEAILCTKYAMLLYYSSQEMFKEN